MQVPSRLISTKKNSLKFETIGTNMFEVIPDLYVTIGNFIPILIDIFCLASLANRKIMKTSVVACRKIPNLKWLLLNPRDKSSCDSKEADGPLPQIKMDLCSL